MPYVKGWGKKLSAPQEKLRLKLLKEERVSRDKQPRPWTMKYRLSAVYRQTKDNLIKSKGGKENVTKEEYAKAYQDAMKFTHENYPLRKVKLDEPKIF